MKGKFCKAALAIMVAVTLAFGVTVPAYAVFETADAPELESYMQTQSSAKSAKKTTKKKAAFSVKTYKSVKRFEYAKGKYVYDQPVLKGSSKAVKAINQSLEKARKKTSREKKAIMNYAKYAQSAFKGSTFYCVYKVKCAQNSNGQVKFVHTSKWFAGGVFEKHRITRSYSLKTGKLLSSTNKKVTGF